MKLSSALPALLFLLNANVNIDAFTPLTPSFVGVRQITPNSYSSNAVCASHHMQNTSSSLHAFLGQNDDEDDDSGSIEKYEQKMSPEERRDNLTVMKQIFKHDLADLQRRRDYAGWVEARKDLKKRQAADPWFDLNDKLKEAVQLDETEEVAKLKKLIEKVGGPPPGVKPSREYALISDIYDTAMSLSRAESIANNEQRKRNTEVWKKMIAEREANEAREEEEYLNNPNKEEEEAKLRRERSMKKIYGEIEERRKKAASRAAEIQEKYRAQLGETENMSPLDRALAEARKAVEKKQQERKKRKAIAEGKPIDDSVKDTSSSTKASSEDGRPRMPGDTDVMRGEIDVDIADSSSVVTDNLRVEVSSKYNAAQSDPPMRKHCFQYTIKITNQSKTDTVQLTSRRFEIQTVGARQKDIVQGQGITGRQPILKPGETFEYTSTAPLSVRPIGTTIIAARMKGSYSYSVVDESIKEEDREIKEAELGTFHFIFPPEQRVKPVTSSDDDDEDEDDEDDDDIDDPPMKSAAVPPPAPAKPSSTMKPPTTLPGDKDMVTGDLPISSVKDSSEVVTDSVRVSVTSQYREERSDAKMKKHCFAYNIRITNERDSSIRLVSRRFEIQTIGAEKKDVVQGPGVTGRQPILQPGESFEYTSTAPLSVKPMPNTPVLARMSGEYSFMVLADDDTTPLSSEALKAKLGMFHFILPQVA